MATAGANLGFGANISGTGISSSGGSGNGSVAFNSTGLGQRTFYGCSTTLDLPTPGGKPSQDAKWVNPPPVRLFAVQHCVLTAYLAWCRQCYVEDNSCSTSNAPSSNAVATRGETRRWKTCTPPPCKCMDSWAYNGHTYYGCAQAPNNQANPSRWCYVAGGTNCAGAMNSLTMGEQRKWMNCKRRETNEEEENGGPCGCQDKWKYGNKIFRGCSSVAAANLNNYVINYLQRKWCYVKASLPNPACSTLFSSLERRLLTACLAWCQGRLPLRSSHGFNRPKQRREMDLRLPGSPSPTLPVQGELAHHKPLRQHNHLHRVHNPTWIHPALVLRTGVQKRVSVGQHLELRCGWGEPGVQDVHPGSL